MKKSMLAVLAFAMLTTTAFAATTFKDVKTSTPYKTAIEWMAQNAIIKGYSDGNFKPDQCVNRAEFLKMMFRTAGVDTDVYSAALFDDTPEGEWYSQYVIAARARGTINGYPDGTFKPGQCVNRVEAIKMAVLEFNDGENPGPWGMYGNPYDVAQIATDVWWKPFFSTAMGGNFVGTDHFVKYDADWSKLGVDNDFANPTYNFGPGESMTRKEVAEMLYRLRAARDNNEEAYTDELEPKPFLREISCTGDWGKFDGGMTSFSFCYSPDWGKATWAASGLSPEVMIGEVYYVTFEESGNPIIAYETLDFEKTGDSDVGNFNWSIVDFSKSEADLEKIMEGENVTMTKENVVVEKMEVNGYNVLKVKSQLTSWDDGEKFTVVDYYIPEVNVAGTIYNLHMHGLEEKEAGLESVLKSMNL